MKLNKTQIPHPCCGRKQIDYVSDAVTLRSSVINNDKELMHD